MTPAGLIKRLEREGKEVPDSLRQKHRAYMREHTQKGRRRRQDSSKRYLQGRFLYTSIKVAIPAWWLVGGK